MEKIDKSTKKSPYPHPHGGHRQRLKKRFLRETLANFQEHEILELLLFYALPQKDTNELAHKLISHFDGLLQVFGASFEELAAFPGISEHTATLIKLCNDLVDWRENMLLEESLDGSSTEDVAAYFSKLMRNRDKECAIAIFLDGRKQKIGNAVVLSEGSLEEVEISSEKILDELTKRHASYFILAHNHPDGSLAPSFADKDTTARLIRTFSDVKKPLLEHYLITNTGVLCLLKYFQDNLMLQ